MAWYRTGTVTVTAGNNGVIGAGTDFIANARVGDAFIGPDGRLYEVTNIASATAISITPNYLGSTASGQGYAISPVSQGYVKASADALRQITDTYGSTVAAIKPWAIADTPAEARDDLELGNSATTNKASSITDTTPGVLIPAGWMGLGGPSITLSNLNLPPADAGSFFIGDDLASSVSGKPSGWNEFAGLNFGSPTAASQNASCQLIFELRGTYGAAYRTRYSVDGSYMACGGR